MAPQTRSMTRVKTAETPSANEVEPQEEVVQAQGPEESEHEADATAPEHWFPKSNRYLYLYEPGEPVKVEQIERVISFLAENQVGSGKDPVRSPHLKAFLQGMGRISPYCEPAAQEAIKVMQETSRNSMICMASSTKSMRKKKTRKFPEVTEAKRPYSAWMLYRKKKLRVLAAARYIERFPLLQMTLDQEPLLQTQARKEALQLLYASGKRKSYVGKTFMTAFEQQKKLEAIRPVPGALPITAQPSAGPAKARVMEWDCYMSEGEAA